MNLKNLSLLYHVPNSYLAYSSLVFRKAETDRIPKIGEQSLKLQSANK